jgi:hypothetical protein
MSLPAPRIPERHDCYNLVVRNQLLEKDPHCHWCRVRVWINITERGERVPDDHATIDHIKSRWVAESTEEYVAMSNLVLACTACNSRRNLEELRSVSPPKIKNPVAPKPTAPPPADAPAGTMKCQKWAKNLLRTIHQRKGLPKPTLAEVRAFAKTLPGYGTPLYRSEPAR